MIFTVEIRNTVIKKLHCTSRDIGTLTPYAM